MKRLLLILFLFPALAGAQTVTPDSLHIIYALASADTFVYQSPVSYEFFIIEAMPVDSMGIPLDHERTFWWEDEVLSRGLRLGKEIDENNHNHHMADLINLAMFGMIRREKLHKQNFNISQFFGKEYPDGQPFAVVHLCF